MGWVWVGPGLGMGWLWVGMGWAWVGYGLVKGWVWIGYRLIMGWLWVGYGLVKGCVWIGKSLVMGWVWVGSGLVLGWVWLGMHLLKTLFLHLSSSSWRTVLVFFNSFLAALISALICNGRLPLLLCQNQQWPEVTSHTQPRVVSRISLTPISKQAYGMRSLSGKTDLYFVPFLSPPQRLCCGRYAEAWEKELIKRAGDDGKGERGEKFPPLHPSRRPPRAWCSLPGPVPTRLCGEREVPAQLGCFGIKGTRFSTYHRLLFTGFIQFIQRRVFVKGMSVHAVLQHLDFLWEKITQAKISKMYITFTFMSSPHTDSTGLTG